MKVMLAATINSLSQLEGAYPLLGSPKLDGIRAIVLDGVVYSRNMKPIPNKWIQRNLPLHAMNGWDGELIVGPVGAPDVFNVTQSGVMRAEGTPDFTFYAFDAIAKYAPNLQFIERFIGLKRNVATLRFKQVKLVPQTTLCNEDEVNEFEAKMLAKGFEGVMLRSGKMPYKHGRSTMKERGLMKLKQFADSEAIVLGVVEQMENTNESIKDELGRGKRSSHKAGKIPKATLGALHVRDVASGVEFEIGSGFDDATRKELWALRDTYGTIIGQTIKYKFQPAGVKEKPRFPVYLGIRHPNDIS